MTISPRTTVAQESQPRVGVGVLMGFHPAIFPLAEEYVRKATRQIQVRRTLGSGTAYLDAGRLG